MDTESGDDESVFFVLNGKGKFYRTLINPMKVPTMDQLLEEVSTGLATAIFRFYTADGIRISTVNDLLQSNSPKVIACPRNERPFMQSSVTLPEIKPSRYAPRAPYKNENTSFNSYASASTSGSNSVEKGSNERAIRQRYRKTVPKTKIISHYAQKKEDVHNETKKWTHTKLSKSVDSGSSTSNKDSGTGNSINSSWNTSENGSGRAESMTERKAQMIRDETMNQNGVHSEEDLILEEESDFEHKNALNHDVGGIESGTDDEDETEEDKKKPAVKSSKINSPGNESKNSCAAVVTPESISSRKSARDDGAGKARESIPETPGVGTPATSRSERLETPAIKTPSRKSTAESRHTVGTPAAQTPATPRRSTPKSITPKSTSPKSETRSAESSATLRAKNAAAIKIQSTFRGFKVRKSLKARFSDNVPNFPMEDEVAYEDLNKNMSDEEQYQRKTATYTVDIKIAARFGSETESDLTIIMFSEESKSEKLTLKQDSDWLTTPKGRFYMDEITRFFINTPNLGLLTKIEVGHDRMGYGAGLFIESIVITENLVDGKQFLFDVNKWFDGHQVDGLTWRSVPLSSFLHLNAKPILRNPVTMGRWEFILHTEKNETGGTTSNLFIIGYGEKDYSVNKIENDRMLREYTLNPLIQVDFGEHIGQLLKVRFEIDGAGDRPNYYLNYVEIRDLDTDERSVVHVQNWLVLKPMEKMKIFQPFREIYIMNRLSMPINMKIYEGKITFADTSLFENENEPIYLQLFGELYDTGIFPVYPKKYPSGKVTYNFQVESVSLQQILEVRIVPKITKFGRDILAGFELLQQIYLNRGVTVSTAKDLFVNEISVREGSHSPFQRIFSNSMIKFDHTNENGSYFKTLLLTNIQGLSTVKKQKKNEPSQDKMHFLVDMSILDDGFCHIPKVTLCDQKEICYDMMPIGEKPKNGTVSFEVKTINRLQKPLSFQLYVNNIGLIKKIRIAVEQIPNKYHTIINKIRLVETISGTETRLEQFQELQDFQVVELACIYPDISPKQTVYFRIVLRTTKGKGKVRPAFKIFGTDGNSGERKYSNSVEISDGMELSIETEAVEIGDPKFIEIEAQAEGKFSWNFEAIVYYMWENRNIRIKYTKKYQAKKMKLKTANSKTKEELIHVNNNEEYENGDDYYEESGL